MSKVLVMAIRSKAVIILVTFFCSYHSSTFFEFLSVSQRTPLVTLVPTCLLISVPVPFFDQNGHLVCYVEAVGLALDVHS